MKTIVISSVALALSLGISAAAQTHHAMGSATTSLSSLLAEAESQNAQVSSAGHAWQASTHRAQEATTLPDPRRRSLALWLPYALLAQLAAMLLPGQYPLVVWAVLAVLVSVVVATWPESLARRFARGGPAAPLHV